MDEFYRTEAAKNKTQVDESYIQEFQSKFAEYLSQYNSDLDSISYANSQNAYNRTKDSAEELLSQVETLRKYGNYGLDDLDDETVSDYWTWLNDAERALRSSLASVSSIDQEYAAYRDFDVEAGQQDIQAMDLAIAQLQQRISGSWQAFARTGSTDFQNLATDYQAELKELQQLRSEKDSYLTKARQMQEAAALSSVADPYSKDYDPAFDELSEYQTSEDETYAQLQQRISDSRQAFARTGNMDFLNLATAYQAELDEHQASEDETYEYINGAENGSRDTINRKYRMRNSGSRSSYQKRNYDYLTEDEISIYNYYYAKSGKEKAEEYLDSLSQILQERANAETVQNAAAYASAHPILASAGSVVTSLGSGLDYLGQLGSDVYLGRELGAETNNMGLITNAIRNSVSEQVDWEIGNWDAFDFLYNTTMSGADSLSAGLLLGGAGGAALGLSAAAQGTSDALERGMNSRQAFWNGLFSGVFEGLFETISIGQFKHLQEIAPNTIKDFFKNLGKSMLVNASEETLTEIANIGYDTLVNGEFANYTLQELKDGAWKDALWQVGEAGLSGALMGMGMGAVGGAINYGQTSKTGRQVQAADQVQRLKEIGSSMSADSVAYQLAGKVDGSTDAYTIGRLFHEVGATLTEANQADIQRSLVEKGFTEDQAAANAEYLAKAIAGEKLTRRQQAALEGNDLLTDAIMESLIEPNTTVYQRTRGYKDVLRELANQKAGVSKDSSKAQTAPETAQTGTKATGQVQSQATQVRARAAQEQQAQWDTAYLKDSGEPVTIQRIASTEGGKLTFQTAEGGTVAASDLDIGSMEPVYEAVAGLDVAPDIANALVSSYSVNADLTPEQYAMQVSSAFQFGKMGIPLGQALTSPASGLLEEGTLRSVYGLGRSFAKAGTEQRQQKVPLQPKKKKGGSVTAESDAVWAQMNEFQMDQYGAVNHIAEALGVDIVLYASQEGEGGRRAPNGWYDPDTDTIHLDINAGLDGKGTMLFTLAHELTHRIYQWSPKKFKALADFLMERYGEAGVSVETLINRKLEVVRRTYKDQKLSESQLYDRAFEEVVADVMEPMLTDGKVLQQLKTQEPGLWEKIRDAITEMAEKIRKAYARLKPDSAEGRAVLQMKDAIEEMEKLFLEGLQDSAQAAAEGQKNTAQEGGKMAASARYSIRDSEIRAIQDIDRKSINNFSSDEIQKTEVLAQRYWKEMGTKSPFFRAWFGDWRAYDQSDIQIATEKGSQRGKEKNHDTGWYINISSKVFSETSNHAAPRNQAARKYLPYINDIVSKAVLLDSSSMGKSKSPNSLIMHSLYAVTDIGNGREVLKLYVEEMNDPNIQDTAKRAYQLQNIEISSLTGEKNAIGSGNALASFETADIRSVADLFAAVKARDKNFQPKAVNSVLLNENGMPKVFYHGTSRGGFTVFDSYGKGKFGLFGIGSYFTDDKNVAQGYTKKGKGNNPQIYEVYLHVENPIDMNASADISAWKTAASDAAGYFEGCATNEDCFRALKEYCEDAMMYRLEAEDYIMDVIRDMGFDGITHIGGGRYNQSDQTRHRVVITFDAEQSKSVTDNVGTFDRSNPDIRYQERDPGLNRVNEVLRTQKEGLREDFDETKAIFDLLNIREQEGIFTQGSLEATARKLKQTAEATGSTKELTALLQEAFQGLARMDRPTWADVEERLQPAVDWLTEHRKKYLDPRAQEALQHIRTSKVYLDAKQKGEAAYQYGSYNDYRKAAMGSIVLTGKNSMSLDSWWKEMATEFSDLGKFDPNLTSTDMPGRLLEIVKELRTLTTDMTLGIDFIASEQELLREVYDSMIRAAVYPAGSGQLLSWQDQRYRENEARIAKLMAKHDRQIQILKKNHDAEIAYILEDFEKQQSRKKESREKIQLRHKIQRTVKQLNSMLTRETKTRHIPEVLKLAVVDALDAVNMDTVMAEERLKVLQDQLEKTADPDERAEIEARIRTVTEMGGSMKKKLDALAAAYAAVRKDADPDLSYAFDEEIGNQIERVRELVGNTALREMTKVQLEAVDELYTVVLTRVRDMNTAFATARQESIDGLGKAVISQEMAQKQKDQRWKRTQSLRAFWWNNEKPVYAFERLGSSTLTELYNNVRKGEDVYAQDMSEARVFQVETAKRFHKKDWDTKQTFTFKDRLGKEFSLNLGQMMTLYAYSKREQAWDHLQYGGFQFAPDTEVLKKTKAGFELAYDWSSAKTFKVDALILGDIISNLTEDQKAFADRMQKYLSDTMGAKGNEISMKLYGIRLFKERNYFPLKSSQAFLEQEKNRANGEVKIKNKGFTKQIQKYANNPVMLRSFDDIWADHVSDMSMYHGFTLPLEDFYRVRNYKEGIFDDPELDELTESRSVVSAIQNAHGKEAVAYIEQLLKDLNGGAVGDPRAAIGKSLTSKHKKAAVMASLSVIVQQPTSIFRAMGLVDFKYFLPYGSRDVATLKTAEARQHKAAWEELKQYAPVAIIKEMGSFDTSVGRSGRDFLNAPEYEGLKERTKAFITDGDYRDEILGKGAAAADELAWVAIWNAVKKETNAKHEGLIGTNREEFLRIAGERFTEVIAKTQVYDSVLSRSANMRSKDAYVSMAMSFMAEPTVTANMVEDGVRKLLSGDKKAAGKIFRGVLASHIMNSMLVSIVYAMRDDDEDETFTEKYVSRLATELIDGMNLLTYIPYARDIWSLVQGYDVERADMTVVADLISALNTRVKLLGTDTVDMDEEELQAYRKKVSDANWALTDMLGSVLGFPTKNIRRDAQGIVNFFQTMSRGRNGQKTTFSSLMDSVLNEVRDSLPGGRSGKSTQDKLYGAIMAGDTTYLQRLKAGYKSETSYHSAIRKALIANDTRITEAAKFRNAGNEKKMNELISEIFKSGFTKKDVEAAINSAGDKLVDDLKKKDPRIREAAEAKIAGNFSQYKSIITKIKQEGAFTQDYVKKAVDALVSELEGAPADRYKNPDWDNAAESVFDVSNYYAAILAGKTKEGSAIFEDLVAEKQGDGYLLWEARDAVASAFTSKVKEAYMNKDYKAEKAVQLMLDYGGLDSKEAAEQKTREWDFEYKYGIAYSSRDNAYYLKRISKDQLREAVKTVEKVSDSEANAYINFLDLAKGNESIPINATEAAKYFEHGEPAGISVQDYLDYRENTKDIEGKNKKALIMEQINALPLTSAQKDALYFANDWSEKKLYEAPWH